MLYYVVVGILLLVVVVIISRWFVNARASRIARILKLLFIFLCVGVAIFLGVTGKVYFSIIPIAFSLIPSIVASTYRGAEQSDHKETENINDFSDNNMNREQALEILGLDKNASDADIKAAHKELLKKVHPDQGGSKYLASQINRAKDLLLKD